jgi:ATP-dependent exoDNAse (exonuclease V) alpha subunit
MAIYHCSVKNISRSSGKSAVASASYRSGEKLYDEEQGKTFSYVKNEVAYSEIFLCENAPREYQDRETLWNAVEQIEKQSNARLAREWEVAIPNELTLEQSKELIRGYAQSLADEGMCVDANIHWKDGNHHAHIMGTTRPIKENGEWGQKEKKAYALDEQGQKIPQIDEKTGQQKIGARGRKMWQRVTVEANDWNKQEKVEE